MKVFYHNDLDGRCAAHVVNKYYNTIPSADMYPMQYGMEFPIAEIEPSEKVFVLDYSIEPEEMKELLTKTEGVRWIDHHQSAIDKYSNFCWVSRDQAERRTHDIGGIRRVGIAGCVLTYTHLISTLDMPEYIALIGDRDTFEFKWEDRTHNFYAGIESFDTYPLAPIWGRLAGLYNTLSVDEVVEIGKPIRRYLDIQDTAFIKEHGFHIEFEGHKCFAVCGRFTKQALQKVSPESEIWIAFRYLNDSWTISLYSDIVAVNKIAEKYIYGGKRGGGHKNAAGFQWGYPPFLGSPKLDGKA